MLTLLPALAAAQDTRSQYLQMFDRDGDGRVSEVEYLQWMSRGFDSMDRNGDGVITVDELPGGHGKPITRQSFEDNLRRQFRKHDINHDGYLDALELTAPPR